MMPTQSFCHPHERGQQVHSTPKMIPPINVHCGAQTATPVCQCTTLQRSKTMPPSRHPPKPCMRDPSTSSSSEKTQDRWLHVEHKQPKTCDDKTPAMSRRLHHQTVPMRHQAHLTDLKTSAQKSVPKKITTRIGRPTATTSSVTFQPENSSKSPRPLSCSARSRGQSNPNLSCRRRQTLDHGRPSERTESP